MAHIANFDAALFRELVQAVDASTAFAVGQNKQGAKAFNELANGDTIMYRAVSKDDATKWEVGLGTYASSGTTLARTTILASSNSDNAVNFEKADGSGGNVEISGISGVASAAAAYTITAWTADRALAGTEATAANVAATLATVINDLIQAGILKGTVAAP